MNSQIRFNITASPRKLISRLPTSRAYYRRLIRYVASLVLLFGSVSLAWAQGSPTTIYVSDTNIGGIFKFDAAGNRTVFASGLNAPTGLAVDTAGNLYVADIHTSSIYKYDPLGARTVFSSGGYLNQPLGLAFDDNGVLYVANVYNNTIIKIDSTGNQTVFVGTQGSPLNCPFGLAFDRSGNLYVSSPNGNSIYKFDPFGNATLFTNTALAGPTGISFDATGNLFVANVQSRRIQKFDPSGQGTVFVDDTGADPYGAAFDSAGNLYVALWNTNTIEKYDLTGQRSAFGNGLGGPYAVAVVPSIPTPTPTATPTPTSTVQVTVQTSPAGLAFTVDGTTYSSTQTFSWVPGSSHTIATTSPQSGGTGVQYVWMNWSGGGAISHTVTPATNTTYTATFRTQYYLTMVCGTGGTVTPASGWKNSGATVSINAQPTNNTQASYSFTSGLGAAPVLTLARTIQFQSQ